MESKIVSVTCLIGLTSWYSECVWVCTDNDEQNYKTTLIFWCWLTDFTITLLLNLLFLCHFQHTFYAFVLNLQRGKHVYLWGKVVQIELTLCNPWWMRWPTTSILRPSFWDNELKMGSSLESRGEVRFALSCTPWNRPKSKCPFKFNSQTFLLSDDLNWQQGW